MGAGGCLKRFYSETFPPFFHSSLLDKSCPGPGADSPARGVVGNKPCPGARCRLPWVLALRRPPGEQQSDVPAFGCPLDVGTLMNPLFLGGTRHGCVLYQPTLSPGSLPSTLLWHCPAPSNHYLLLFLLFMLFDNICTVQCRCSHYSLLFLLFMLFDTYQTHRFMSNDTLIIHIYTNVCAL